MAIRLDPNVSSMAGQKPASGASAPVNANDFKQYAALRRGADAHDPETLRQVARQFESLFTKMMMDSMRSASFGDSLFGSDQADMYQGMMDDQMAVQLSSGKGIGLADMLIRQLSQGGQGAGAAAGAASSLGVSRSGSADVAVDRALPIDDAQRRKFVEQMLPHARTAALQLGVDERSVLAQAALETGWGTSQPGDGSGGSNNVFGIKAGAGWGGRSVTSETTEFAGGIAGRESARFRAYGSVAENMNDYVQLLSGSPRYAAALNTGTDVRAFATALQRGGYATDPRYADKVVAVAAQLDQLNVTGFKSGGNSPIQAASTVEGNG
jgi:peptidoglycan hydrolase FlgJ